MGEAMTRNVRRSRGTVGEHAGGDGSGLGNTRVAGGISTGGSVCADATEP